MGIFSVSYSLTGDVPRWLQTPRGDPRQPAYCMPKHLSTKENSTRLFDVLLDAAAQGSARLLVH